MYPNLVHVSLAYCNTQTIIFKTLYQLYWLPGEIEMWSLLTFVVVVGLHVGVVDDVGVLIIPDEE